VTAQPIESPSDPVVILRDLPERERDEFLRQYHEAVEAAREPAGYERLRNLLHVWSLTVIATNRPGYYEELAAVRDGTSSTVAVSEAIPDWADRLAASRAVSGDLSGRIKRPGAEANAGPSRPCI
jgi:hypothetical protein